MEDIFKVRLKQIELPEHEILNMQLDVERLEQMIHEERCDAVIAPRLFQKILGSLKVPLYQANFTPLAEEEIRLTLDHVNQILDIFRHQHTLNARTEMMLKQSFDAVFCLDEQGRIKLWNNYAETLFHLQGKSLLKEQIWDVLQIESSEVLKSSVENKSPLMGQPILVDEPGICSKCISLSGERGDYCSFQPVDFIEEHGSGIQSKGGKKRTCRKISFF